ncbi:MAG: mechanosensitive ion channel [Chloroflexi bacterium]|nr:mechanosensitive ion channel [Chloroflexota bacterium]
MEDILNRIVTAVSLYLPNILLALGILILGWIVALVLRSLTRNLLGRTNIDDRLARSMGYDQTASDEQIPIENWISSAVFWLVMLVTLLAFFQALDIPAVSGPLENFVNQIVAILPGILGAIILLLIAWVIATLLRAVVVRLINASGISRRLSEGAEIPAHDRVTVSQTIGNVVYWLVFLLFLPAVLDALNLQGLLAPVQQLVDEILGVLPNLLGAALILLIGWLVARIVRQIVTNLLAGLGIDRWGQEVGGVDTTGRLRLSNIIGTIVYVLILIPVAIAALNALNIPAVSGPAANMLTNLLNALPAIFGAFLLLAIAYFVARCVGVFVASILTSLGFDRLFTWLGIYRQPPGVVTPDLSPSETPGEAAERAARTGGPTAVAPGGRTPSQIAGSLTTIAIMLFAIMEAANLLGFSALSVMLSGFIVAAWQVLIGLIIFGLGLYLANQAANWIRDSGVANSGLLATVARVAILVFAAALALREMGIAASIVNLAFGLLLGAVAVAFALAFGLGGRDAASRQIERWRNDLSTGPSTPPGLTGGAMTSPSELSDE